MALIEIKRDPSRRELRWFGVMFAVFFAIVGGLVRWKFGVPAASTVIWLTAAGLTLLYYALPPLRRPLYLGSATACLGGFRAYMDCRRCGQLCIALVCG